MKDDIDPDQGKFRLKIERVKESGVHQDTYQLYAYVLLYVKAIELYERDIHEIHHALGAKIYLPFMSI